MESNIDSDECDLDSTWENEQENKTSSKKVYKKSRRNMNAAKDTQDFRHSCRNIDDGDNEPGQGRFYNLEFYRGQIRSSPDNIHIDDFHKLWPGQYYKLENVHTYIQWLFPLEVPGMNCRAHVLTKKEIKHFRRDKQALRNLVKSYEIMLDFYGIRLVDKSTGEVERADNWTQRFNDLNRHTLNNLRITRILKCLGTLGLEHYQAPLVKFFLHETLVMGELQSLKHSVLEYFMFVVLDKSKRRELVRYAFKHFRPQEDFVWGPRNILRKENAKEGEQQRVKTTEKTKKNNKTDPRSPEKISENPCENNPQKDNKRVIPNKSAEKNIAGVLGANGGSQCSSNSKKVEKQNQGMSVGDVEMKPETTVNGDEKSNIVKKTCTRDISISTNKLVKENIRCNQGANNENSQCSLKNENMIPTEMMPTEMSVGDDDDDDGNEMSVGVDSQNCSP